MAGPFDSPSASPGGAERETAAVDYDPAALSSPGEPSLIARVLARNEASLMAIDGVEGVGIGRDRIGDDAIVVYLRDASVASRVPSQVEGYNVETAVTGIVDAY